MASILEGELAQTIADALLDAEIPFDVVLTRLVPTEGPNPWTPGEPVPTPYPCKGFVEAWTADYIAGGLVQSNDLKVVILAATLTITPELTDTITVRGVTYSIITIAPDPALATITLQVRA